MDLFKADKNSYEYISGNSIVPSVARSGVGILTRKTK